MTLSQYDVAFFEAFAEEAEKLKHYLPNSQSAYFTEQTIQDEGLTQPIAPIISVRTQSVIPENWAGQLTAIVTRSTGYDHILHYRQATATAVPAGHLPLYCNRAVAEQALLLWMSLLRHLPQQCLSFKQFERNHLTGKETLGRRLVVVGVGSIGYEVIAIGKGLGMQVWGVDIDEKYPDVDYRSPETALAAADIIVCAMNLTKNNRGYFDKDRWDKVKPGAVFINISRGELSPCVDLCYGLEQQRLAGVALDVFNEEANIAGFLRDTGFKDTVELQAFKALQQDQRVIFTPHNAFNTEEAVDRKAEQTVQQLVSWQQTGKFIWPV